MSTTETLIDDARDEAEVERADFMHERHGGDDFLQLAEDCQVCAETLTGHAGHEGEYADPDECFICRKALDTFLRWGETMPDPSWTVGPDGYVRAPLSNEGAR